MINFSVHYPYEFDIVNSKELDRGDVTFTLISGDHVFNVRPLRRGENILQPGSDLSFVFKTGQNIGGGAHLAARPGRDGLMPRDLVQPFELAFSYDKITSNFDRYKKMIGRSEKDVIEYKKINLLDESTSPSNPRVFSWKGNLFLIGTGVGSSFSGTVPCVNLYKWNEAREGFQKTHIFFADSNSFLHDSCDYVVHNDELFITFFSDVNYIACYRAKDESASSWDLTSSFEVPIEPEVWTSQNFRYRIRAASDSFAVNIVVMFAWQRNFELKSYQESEMLQLVSLDNCLSFSSGGEASSFLISSSALGRVQQNYNKNVLGLFTVIRNIDPPENDEPFNINFDMYYDKKIGSFVIMKSGEGDSTLVDSKAEQRLPNKCYLVGIKNITGNYFMWESCLKLPLDYNMTVPDLSNYQAPWSPVFEERIRDVNRNFDDGVMFSLPAHARAMVLEDVCIVVGDSVNDLIVTGRNLRIADGGVVGTGSNLDYPGFEYPYLDTKAVYFNGEFTEHPEGDDVINERAFSVLATEFSFIHQDAVIPGNYEGKIYSYGGKFHSEIAFVCGPLMFETSSIFPKGFRSYGLLNGDRWFSPIACRWRGSLIASASYIYKNNYTFFSVLGPMSNVGEKYGYQHNYCPYVPMFLFGWSEHSVGEGSEITFSEPSAHFNSGTGNQRFKISSDEESSYCYLSDRVVMGDGISIVSGRGLVDSPTRYWTTIGRAQGGNFKVRVGFSTNVDVSEASIPNVCLCKAVVGNRKYSIHIVQAAEGAPKKIALKYDPTATASLTRTVDIDTFGLGDLDNYMEVMFGRGIDRREDSYVFIWVRKKGGEWIKGNVAGGINNLIQHPDVGPIEWSPEDWEFIPLEENPSYPDEMRPTKLRNGIWVGLLSAENIAEGSDVRMRVRQVAISSYGYRYRPAYSKSFRRRRIDGEGPSTSSFQYSFEPVQSYSPIIELPDGSELLLEPVKPNESSSLFRESSYELLPSRTRNSPANVTNNISDSIYDFTDTFESRPNFEIILKSKDGLPVDCLSLINMVGFFAFNLSSGDYNESTGVWTNKETERYFIPYTRHRVEEVDGRTILLEEDESFDYQRDQLVGHSIVVYNYDTGSIKDHRIITSNFDRMITVDRPVEISDREGVRILKRNGSFDVPQNIGVTGKNYFSISFLSTSDASLRAIGEIVLGKWVDLSDLHITISRERVKGFEATTSPTGLLFPGSVESNSGVKDSLAVSFTQLVNGNGDADRCFNLFSDIYHLQKNFPILMDYDGKPSTEFVSFSGGISFAPSDYNSSLDITLLSQTPKSIPKPNGIFINKRYTVEIQAFSGSSVIGFETTSGSLNLRAVPVNFNEPGAIYVWDNGNGQTLTGSEVALSYSQRGSYNVALRVYVAGREVAAKFQTVYYVVPLTTSYFVSYLEGLGSLHLLAIISKDDDGNTVNDSTTTVYIEGRNSAGQITATAQGTPLEGTLITVIAGVPSTVRYEARDLNGATGSVSVTSMLPPTTIG